MSLLWSELCCLCCLAFSLACKPQPCHSLRRVCSAPESPGPLIENSKQPIISNDWHLDETKKNKTKKINKIWNNLRTVCARCDFKRIIPTVSVESLCAHYNQRQTDGLSVEVNHIQKKDLKTEFSVLMNHRLSPPDSTVCRMSQWVSLISCLSSGVTDSKHY